jgi:uncharacterized protein
VQPAVVGTSAEIVRGKSCLRNAANWRRRSKSYIRSLVKITWDEPKRKANVAKHGVDFADIGEEFFAAAIVVPGKDGRWKAIGWLGRFIALVIFRPLGAEALSIVSARPASRKERKVVHGRSE